VVHMILKCVLKALTRHWARGTDSLRNDHADTISWEERSRWVLAALAVCHPFGTHAHPLTSVLYVTVATVYVTN